MSPVVLADPAIQKLWLLLSSPIFSKMKLSSVSELRMTGIQSFQIPENIIWFRNNKIKIYLVDNLRL